MTTRKQIDQFRHFNRFYTNYIGLLDNSIYDSPVNLTEARILYELDSRPGSSAKELRQRLSLDKGYLSRLLKRCVSQGWIKGSTSSKDARIRELNLTADGKHLMEKLHAQAAAQAEKALSHLSHDDRHQLLAAMDTIEKTLAP